MPKPYSLIPKPQPLNPKRPMNSDRFVAEALPDLTVWAPEFPTSLNIGVSTARVRGPRTLRCEGLEFQSLGFKVFKGFRVVG